ncbi:MAG: Nitrogen assimilation transcription factor nit-4 [Peltula sp. TS41687]|nr:MAG: Nitrogen assimilation transcription factor nit-4 [Peltula sp. TS41687]
MAIKTKDEPDISNDGLINPDAPTKPSSGAKSRKRDKDSPASSKRRCCDGNTPSCAACASVYGTDCVYDPSSDNRRKGVYKKTIDSLRTRNSTLQTLIQAILNSSEEEVLGLVREIRSCDSLDDVAESILANGTGPGSVDDDLESPTNEARLSDVPTFETELSGKLGGLRLEDGSVRFIGGTSNLIYLAPGHEDSGVASPLGPLEQGPHQEQPFLSWTSVTSDQKLISHLLNMYFTWHYPYFTTLSKSLFLRDFSSGKPLDHRGASRAYCSSLLVNAILAVGCHFTSDPGARAQPEDPSTAGDHFFKEAKRLILENDEHEKPKLTTVQALALMSVREAGCGREAKGWVYSGMSFRMALDLGLNIDSGTLSSGTEWSLDEQAIDARRITFWGCFLFDKCWSNYLGRQPQLPSSIVTAPKIDVFPVEDGTHWYPYTDAGTSQAHSQPARTRAIALHISKLCEISNDLLNFFYDPAHVDRHVSKSVELKKLSELHRRLEAWRKDLPKGLEAREGALPSVLLMHMFFQLLFIHLFRPFLKYNQATSPLPPQVSPRKQCTQAATTISKLLRLYKRTYGLRQICNIAVYIAHSACTIHLLNLPEKMATRDIVYGVRHLEEIAEGWPCASRTLTILNVLAQRWKISLPDEAAAVLARSDLAYRPLDREDSSSPKMLTAVSKRTLDFMPSTAGSTSYNSPSAAPPSSSIPASSATSPDTQSTATQQNVSGPGSVVNYDSPFLPPPPYNPVNGVVMPQMGGPATEAQVSLSLSTSGVLGSTSGLVQESQDWWFKDQSSFHLGFGNWHGIGTDQTGDEDGRNTSFPSITNQVDAQNLSGLSDAEWYA